MPGKEESEQGKTLATSGLILPRSTKSIELKLSYFWICRISLGVMSGQ